MELKMQKEGSQACWVPGMKSKPKSLGFQCVTPPCGCWIVLCLRTPVACEHSLFHSLLFLFYGCNVFSNLSAETEHSSLPRVLGTASAVSGSLWTSIFVFHAAGALYLCTKL